mmetsp:Transcript_9225/g.56050  ORF Transcript_9225/g.56050 Transcript_9225/m.56050 type:complete len:208 (+) Transcript_9225:183-806(+)
MVRAKRREIRSTWRRKDQWRNHQRSASSACRPRRRRIQPHHCFDARQAENTARRKVPSNGSDAPAYVRAMSAVLPLSTIATDMDLPARVPCPRTWPPTDLGRGRPEPRKVSMHLDLDRLGRRRAVSNRRKRADGMAAHRGTCWRSSGLDAATRVRRPPSDHQGFTGRERIPHDDEQIECDSQPDTGDPLGSVHGHRVHVMDCSCGGG